MSIYAGQRDNKVSRFVAHGDNTAVFPGLLDQFGSFNFFFFSSFVCLCACLLGKDLTCHSFQAKRHGWLVFSHLFQPLTSHELWQTVRQHYGFDLGLSYEEMDSSQIIAESNMQTR